MPDDLVDDDEVLYRRVPNNRNQIIEDAPSVLRLSSSAFNDEKKKPSVDRAKLLDMDPSRAKKKETEGIVGLVAGHVRAIDNVQQLNKAGIVIQHHQVDVIPEPLLPENPAH